MTDDKAKALYNSCIINTFIKLLKSRYPQVNIPRLLADAGIEHYQVEDEGHWFSQEEVDRFYEELVRATGNRDIAKEAGRYSASPDALGTMARYLMGLIGPARVFSMVEKLSAGYTRSAHYTSRSLGRNAIEIMVKPLPGVKEKKYQCDNRIGYFQAAVQVFTRKLPRIEHTECIFQGGDCCRYVISWQESTSATWNRIRNTLFLIVAAVSIHFSMYLPHDLLKLLPPVSLLLLFLLTVYSEHRESKDLVSAVDNLRSSMDSILSNAAYNVNHALLINEIGQTISKEIKLDALLKGVIEVLEKRLDYDRGLILLADKTKEYLVFSTGFGYSEEILAFLEDTSFHLTKPDSKGIFVICYRERKPFLINDVEEIEGNLSARSLEFAKLIGSKSFICCPIIYEDESVGVLAVDNIQTKRPLLQSDINLLMGIAPEIGISVHNALLIEDQDRQFRSILQTLAASIDARDYMTAGHSQKVTEYSLGICRELGLSKEYTDMILVAAQLHDYGKIGIRDSILKKAGPLSESEREEIKTHVVKTEEILRQAHFEGIYKEVPRIAGSHHERLDGRGYPRGLKGEEIPLGARIIAVADFYEAVTAKRHYRDPMPYNEATEYLVRECGKHFDPVVVEAFLVYLSREGLLKSEDSVLRPQQVISGV